MENITHSLDKLEELAKRIGRSQQLGYPLPSGITKGWEVTMLLHIENLRKRLNTKIPAGAGSVIDS